MHASGTSSAGVVDQKVGAVAEDVVELIAGLSPRKRVAIDALVIGHTPAKAAEVAGCHRGTVSRWIHEDADFNAALNALDREAIRLGNTRLMSLIPTALMVIEHAIDKGDVRAAHQLLKLTLFSKRTFGPVSTELVAREMKIAELEHQVMLLKQQVDFEELNEASIEREKDVARKTRNRLSDEERYRSYAAKDEEAQRGEQAARIAAEAEARKSQRPAPAQQPKSQSTTPAQSPSQNVQVTPTMKVPPAAAPAATVVSKAAIAPTASTGFASPSASISPASKHPVPPAMREHDSRIAAAAKSAAQSVANSLTNPGSQKKP